jgi:hypothetical protein
VVDTSHDGQIILCDTSHLELVDTVLVESVE